MRRKSLDLTGQRFGKWVVLKKHVTRGSCGEVLWESRCDCGTVANVKAANLVKGASKSCGCLRYEATHNMTGVPTFKSWESMKQRCMNKNSPDYKNYGGRGIDVCERWANSFDNFFTDMGFRPDGATLDRIDVNQGYCPENCRWATKLEQERNKRITLHISAFGKTLTPQDWAEQTGLSPRVIIERIRSGWDAETALTKPNRKKA